MRVLILVLASDTDPIYQKFQAVWERASHPNADIFFLKACPTIERDVMEGNTIYIRCEESFETVYQKQMRCFRLLLPILQKYNYVFRTNLSSFLDISKYIQFCESLPNMGVYSGVIGHHNEIPFASGAGFTITPDLIQRLMEENPPNVFLDDVSIGSAIAKWGISIIPANRVDHIAGGIVQHSSPTSMIVFHHRIKTENREADVELLTSLFKDGQSIVVGKPLPKSPF